MLPTIGWQMDPFGYSSSNAALKTGAPGFDAPALAADLGQ